jgi:hypothetical protein
MNIRAMASRAQVVAGGVHQLAGLLNVVAGQDAVALDDVAADDDRLHVGWSRAENHDGYRVAEPVQMRGAHVDDRDVGLLSGCQGADLVFELPDPGVIVRVPPLSAIRSNSGSVSMLPCT